MKKGEQLQAMEGLHASKISYSYGVPMHNKFRFEKFCFTQTIVQDVERIIVLLLLYT